MTTVRCDPPADFWESGFAVFSEKLSSDTIDGLRVAIESIPRGDSVRGTRQNIYGIRNLLELSPAVRMLIAIPVVRRFVTPILGDAAFATRATFFDKVPGANWTLGWHQDRIISVAKRHEVAGFTGWRLKAGVWHVEPPAPILARMVAVRLHLDDCGPGNGPLRVIPGSHRSVWGENDISDWTRRTPAVTCLVQAGGVVAMCPLVLHASSRATAPAHRRVIHIEFANHDLPDDLDWIQRIGPSQE